MATQREKPAHVEAIARFREKHPDPANLIGGGQLEHFDKGWALLIFPTKCRVAHWYTRVGFARIGFDQATALCDTGATGLVHHLHGRGNFPQCRNCVKVMTRMIRNGTLK